jgi:hypothetical protein
MLLPIPPECWKPSINCFKNIVSTFLNFAAGGVAKYGCGKYFKMKNLENDVFQRGNLRHESKQLTFTEWM